MWVLKGKGLRDGGFPTFPQYAGLQLLLDGQWVTSGLL